MTKTPDNPTDATAASAGRDNSRALDEQLSFALYAASRAVINAYRPLLHELGLTYPQYLVMLVLWERGECLIKDLGAVLRLDYGTLSPLLKRLEGAGLIRRTRQLEDERSVQVVLTERGIALREDAAAVPTFIGNAIGLDDESLATLRTTLGRLTALVSAHPHRPPPTRRAPMTTITTDDGTQPDAEDRSQRPQRGLTDAHEGQPAPAGT